MLTTLALSLQPASALPRNFVPQDLFRRIQKIPLGKSELPPGFTLPPSSQDAHPGFPTAWSPSRPVPWRPGGAELAFALRGPDQLDLLGYTVYETTKQALASLAAGPKSHSFGFAPPNSRPVGKVPGFRLSAVWHANVPEPDVVEADVIVSGLVEVRSLTVVSGRGDGTALQRNFALIRAGVSHLQRVMNARP